MFLASNYSGTKYLFAILLWLTVICAFAQKPDRLRTIAEPLEQQLENLSERTGEEADYSQLYDEMAQLHNHPVNINSKDENELRRLLLLNELQIKNLIDYTTQYGNMVSIYEMQVIEGFNEEIITQLLPFITLSEEKTIPFSWKNVWKYGKTNIMLRWQRALQLPAGYAKVSDSLKFAHPNNYFLGSPNAVFTRVQYAYKDIFKAGFAAEKDAGEPFWPRIDSLKKGFDFYSFHIFLKNIGRLKQFAIGDYYVQLGQGLNIWSGFTLGKTMGSVLMRKRAPALRPHASASEYGFMRGVAATFKLGIFDLTAFYSNRKTDANLLPADTILSPEQQITSLQQTGYHRTAVELYDKASVREQMAGGNLHYNGQRFRAGITAFHVNYDKPFAVANALYKKFQPSLTQNTYLGADYSYNYNRLTLFGEASHQWQAGNAFLQGLSFTPIQRFSATLLYRNYAKNYFNPYNGAFSESSNTTNEHGLYFGIMAMPFKKITLNAFADMYRFPWLRYRADAPSGGHELSAQVAFALQKGDISIGCRYRENPLNYLPTGRYTNTITQIKHSNYRFQFNYQALNNLQLQSRIEITRHIAQNKSMGYLLYQSLKYTFPFRESAVYLRYALFDTDSYDARMYAYENDVIYSFSIPAFYGKGSRVYVMLNTHLAKNITLTLRYAQTWFTDRNIISSGASQINANTRSDLKCMLNIQF